MPGKRGETEISRRDLLKLGAVAAAATSVMGAAGAQGGAAAGQVAGTRPNILFLMADQFRADCVGADGNSVIHTPNLDRIAHEGVLFSSAYSSTPTCTPARSGLLTGLAPWRHGMLAYGRVAEKYPLELPRALRDAGYHTLGLGKMHWHPQRNLHGFHTTILDESGREESIDFRSDYRSWFMSQAPTVQYDATGIGWNDYDAKPYVLPEELHPTHWMGETAVRFLESYNQPEPFFLKVSFARPHSPYDPPKRFWDMYEGADLPEASVGSWAGRYAKPSGPEPHAWRGDFGREQVRKSRQGYYGSVSFIDEQIGRILGVLERRGMLENTLILFTADHGDMTGDHNLWRKSYAYEASARIPMLMRWPDSLCKAERGQVLGQPVELRDVLPTCLDAAAAPAPGDIDGSSMLPLVQGGGAKWREFIDLEHGECYSPDNHWNALTDGRHKYIYHAHTGEEQLFDLQNDPGELTDLASEAGHKARVKEWRGRLIDYLAERGEWFVKDGDLVVREKSMLYSPNYPGCSCHPKA